MAFDEMIIGRIFEQFPLLVQFLILYIFIYYLKLLRESELFDFKERGSERPISLLQQAIFFTTSKMAF